MHPHASACFIHYLRIRYAILKLRNNDRKNAEKVFRNFPHKYTHQPALQARAGILSAQFSTFARTASLSNDEILTFVREKVT